MPRKSQRKIRRIAPIPALAPTQASSETDLQPDAGLLFARLFEATPDASLLVNERGEIILANHRAEIMFGYPHEELIGQQIEILIPAEYRSLHVHHRAQYQAAPRMRPMGAGLALLARRRNGAHFPVDITLSPVQTTTNALTLCVVRDTSVSLARQKALQEQSRLVTLTLQIASAANQTSEVNEVFQFAIDQICAYLDWPIGHAWMINAEGEAVSSYWWNRSMPEKYEALRLEIQTIQYQAGRGMVGTAMVQGLPIWMTYPADRPNMVQADLLREHKLLTAFALPVIAGRTVVAVLAFYSDRVVEPDSEVLAMLPHIGAQLGRVIERAHLLADLDELKHALLSSVENERVRLAQELHDGPLQDLYGVFFQLQDIKEDTDQAHLPILEASLQSIQQISATLRTISGELRPSTLVHLGLQKAIYAHAARLQERFPALRFHLDLTDKEPLLAPSLRLSLYRIYHHLIANVLRHSQAQNVWIRMTHEGQQLFLDVEDDGQGFEVPSNWVELVRQGRFGLAGMTERVEAAHGSWEIESVAGQGTRVHVIIPLNHTT